MNEVRRRPPQPPPLYQNSGVEHFQGESYHLNLAITSMSAGRWIPDPATLAAELFRCAQGRSDREALFLLRGFAKQKTRDTLYWAEVLLSPLEFCEIDQIVYVLAEWEAFLYCQDQRTFDRWWAA